MKNEIIVSIVLPTIPSTLLEMLDLVFMPVYLKPVHHIHCIWILHIKRHELPSLVTHRMIATSFKENKNISFSQR